MLLYAIIAGAVVSGIIMFVANNKAKQGVSWGQPVAIVFGIIAIGLACWALFENVMGKSDEQKTAEKWQVVRGKGAAEWFNANCKGKKLLFVRPPQIANQSKDYQYDAFISAIDGLTYETFEVPPAKERVGEDMPGEMMLDGLMPGAPINAQTKKIMKETADEFQKAIEAKVAADKYDTVVFFTSVYDFMLFPKPYGIIPAFKDKQYIFMFGIEDQKLKWYPKQIIAALGDKPLTNPEDYDKDPTGDQSTDFNYRYEFKQPAAAKK